ncbi:hypothetical protein [Heliomarina baculiformis]|uniref:hypothetical protein n=1 Tax=Heliomarina baculiformis TaxID=2872036 RepID=UPI001EE31D5A|nr:hypothetical protein [Heliomarina baculiformis]
MFDHAAFAGDAADTEEFGGKFQAAENSLQKKKNIVPLPPSDGRTRPPTPVKRRISAGLPPLALAVDMVHERFVRLGLPDR